MQCCILVTHNNISSFVNFRDYSEIFREQVRAFKGACLQVQRQLKQKPKRFQIAQRVLGPLFTLKDSKCGQQCKARDADTFLRPSHEFLF